MQKERILVTGAAGFIASHIVDAYVAAGHHVAVLDNLDTGSKKNANAKAVFYKADMRDRAAVEKVFKKEKPTIVNCHAAIASVARSMADLPETLEVNVIGTSNVLEAAGRHGVKKVIFASTGGALYGSPKKILCNEKVAIDPLSPYALSKVMGEEAVRYFAGRNKFSYTILRYANVYGPRQNPKGEAGVVAIFGGLFMEKRLPTIFGDGTKARDYVYVSDIANANVLALTKGDNREFNIGRGIPTSDREVYDEIARYFKVTYAPNFAPYRQGEVYKIALDASAAKKVLGWKAKVDLRKGITMTLDALTKRK